MENVLEDIQCRKNFRNWLEINCLKEKECYVLIQMKEVEKGVLLYIDAVYEALCSGWIDSVTRKDLKGRRLQRFSPRRKKSNWTELNKERARFLKKTGQMTKHGEAVLPDLDEKFVVDPNILEIFEKDEEFLKKVKELPELYFRIRVDNIQKIKKDKDLFLKRLNKFIEMTKKGRMFGRWNDFGRLI